VVDVVGLFAAGGGARYGESVTQLEHSLQCAALARRARADDEVVLAALLHDVGHLAARAPEGPAGHHGHQGAGLLRPCVPARVAWLIEHHVVAKRYLCSVDPRYAERLSPASVRSLVAQGAALDVEERLGPRGPALVRRRRPHSPLGRRGRDRRRGLPATRRVSAAHRALAGAAVVAGGGGYRLT